MLRKSRRMTTKMFEETLKNGRVVHSSLLILRYLNVPADPTNRFAAVAPVKIAKTSVARHRIRRRIYAAVHPLLARLPAGLRAIVFAKVPAAEVTDGDFQSEVEGLFVKAGLLR